MRVSKGLGSGVSVYSHPVTKTSSRLTNELVSIHQDQICCEKVLTRERLCKLGRHSEVMNCAPSAGTINLVMNNTL